MLYSQNIYCNAHIQTKMPKPTSSAAQVITDGIKNKW